MGGTLRLYCPRQMGGTHRQPEREEQKMSKYSTITTSNGFATGTIIKSDSGKYFAGYDFMGSVNWNDTCYDAVLMDQEEAEQIIRDL